MSLNKTLSIIQENVNHYFCPIFLIFGLIGCFFNILLFSQKQFRIISCCTYFLSSSVVMLIALIVGFVPHIYSSNNRNLINKIFVFCKIHGYLSQSLAMMYRWLMTMACIDRYMISSDNRNLREFANPRIAYSIIIKMLIICIVLPLHNLIFLEIKRGLCMNSVAAFAKYHSLFSFIFGGFLPILLMFISAILIRSNLASKQVRRQYYIYYKNPNKKVRLFNERDQQVLLMLFIQVIFYIITTIPWLILLLYSSSTYSIKNKTNNRKIIERFLKYLTEILIYMYPTLSFYIYTLTSHTFRQALVNLISRLLIQK